MSIHKSLVIKSKLKRHRNVLNRYERIIALKEKGLWDEEQSVFNLPKVRVYAAIKKGKGKGKKKEKE